MLSVRDANQTRKNVADTTFKLEQDFFGCKTWRKTMQCLSITLIWKFEVQFPETIQIFQIPKIGITLLSDDL